jgi:hypothetical protein
MSADNWTDCPRCANKDQRRYDKELEALNDMYGKVPKEVFIKAQKAIKPPKLPDERPYTFREDYEVYGAEEGTVNISYSGSCTECNLHLHFKHEHEIPGIDD